MVRIQRILCPVDFFPASLRAADYAIGLARNYDAKLHLLHIVSPPLYSAQEYVFDVSDLIESLERQSAQGMAKLEKKARAAGLTVYTDIRTGDVRREIESAVRTTKADILVMGTHGRRGMEKWFLGSVTEAMLRRSPIPVLTIGVRNQRRGRLPVIRRILVTTDLSKSTADALDLALSVARENRASLTLLHVLEDMRALTSEKYRQELTERLPGELLKLIPAAGQDWCEIETRIEAGTPYHVILRVLRKDKFDLLVMGTHGKGMLDRALLGSTSERVVRGARCPVMLIPPKKKAKSNRPAQRRAA